MQTQYSEVVKAIEAGVFALSLIILALVQSPLHPAASQSATDSHPVESSVKQ